MQTIKPQDIEVIVKYGIISVNGKLVSVDTHLQK